MLASGEDTVGYVDYDGFRCQRIAKHLTNDFMKQTGFARPVGHNILWLTASRTTANCDFVLVTLAPVLY
jgi:hypothetical protein